MPADDADKLEELLAPQGELFREVAFQVISMLRQRIHVDGLAADGTQIGTYSPEYMKVRSGNYGNTPKVSRGPNKGQKRKGSSGTITRGERAGQPRPNYGFPAGDSKVILVLTGQLERDYAVLPGEKGGWGIGFLNAHNFEKATWNNERYGHVVWDLTDEELQEVVRITEQLITKYGNEIS